MNKLRGPFVVPVLIAQEEEYFLFIGPFLSL